MLFKFEMFNNYQSIGLRFERAVPVYLYVLGIWF